MAGYGNAKPAKVPGRKAMPTKITGKKAIPIPKKSGKPKRKGRQTK